MTISKVKLHQASNCLKNRHFTGTDLIKKYKLIIFHLTDKFIYVCNLRMILVTIDLDGQARIPGIASS